MLSPAELLLLRAEAGPGSFARGREYAEGGAVTKAVWDEPGRRVVGTVRGSRSQPYHVAIRLERGGAGEIEGIQGSCTCPVGFNCKHVVAVLLTAPGGRATSPPAWEHTLQGILAPEPAPAPPAAHERLGLQIELVDHRPRPGLPGGSGPPGLRLRVVRPGASRGWVRGGLSWAGLAQYRADERNPALRAQVGLLRELLALSRLSDAYPVYGYRDEQPVWLESLPSPRLWDLLAEAASVGLPLVRAGRNGYPATLHQRPARVAVDATRSDAGVQVRATISHDGGDLEPGRAMLIGHPAHGVAWWEGEPDAKETPPLQLAPLDERIGDELRPLFEAASVVVPAGDEGRFRARVLPRLARVVPLTSSDGSVALPATATRLLLVVTHLPGPAVRLRWEQGTPGGEARRPLDPAEAGPDLRAAIDEAVRLSAPMPVLVEATPTGPRPRTGVELAGMAAAHFATDVLPALERAEGIVVTEEGDRPDFREATEGPTVTLRARAGADGRSDWFDLGVEVKLEGEEVPFGDLFRALAEGRPHLVLPSGTWTTLDRPELHRLAQLIEEARELRDAPPASVRVSRFQAGWWEELTDAGADTVGAGAWERAVRGLADAADRTEHPQPAGLRAELRPYQLTGFNWMAYLHQHRLGGILADDMGLGKTLQGLALICHTRAEGRPWLVVAPTSVVGGWAAEAARFAPDLRVGVVTETGARRGTPIGELAAGSDVVVTSYALLRLEHEAYGAVTWGGMILDEAQFAKNPSSQTYRRIAAVPVATKVAMTGTPMENNLMELWALLSLTAPGLFARAEHFAERYRRPIERHGDAERLEELRRRIRPLVLRRTKEQVAADLPPKQEQVLEVDLHARHRRIYETYLQRERQKVLGLLGDMSKNRLAIFRSLTLLRQAALAAALVDPAHHDVPSAKLDTLDEMLGEIVADGHRVLIFSQFTRFLSLARVRLERNGIPHAYLDGQSRDRAATIDAFRSGDVPAFLISLKAGGFGLNLAEADYCVLLDPWWNPATEAQAVDRAHRIGQTRKVMVYRLVARDTIEQKVMALQERKRALFASVIDAGGFEAGALTADDIRGLVEG